MSAVNKKNTHQNKFLFNLTRIVLPDLCSLSLYVYILCFMLRYIHSAIKLYIIRYLHSSIYKHENACCVRARVTLCGMHRGNCKRPISRYVFFITYFSSSSKRNLGMYFINLFRVFLKGESDCLLKNIWGHGIIFWQYCTMGSTRFRHGYNTKNMNYF